MKGRVETSSVTRHIDGMLRVALLRIGPTARPTLLLRRVVKPVRTVSRALLHKRAGLLASGSSDDAGLPSIAASGTNLRFVPSYSDGLAPELHRLFSSVRGVSRVVAPGDAVSFDYHCALMSLPGILNCVPNGDFPAYIAAPTPMALDADPGPKIGLVWAGNPRHANDLNRSRALTEFSPLVRPNLSFYGVQKGPAAHQAPPPSMQFRDLEDDLHDFQDTARALMALDLLITVDTATAHLAGALGRPVWVLLPLVADWRWLRDRDDSPWYPSMRLFRQNKSGDWKPVFMAVRTVLREILGKGQ